MGARDLELRHQLRTRQQADSVFRRTEVRRKRTQASPVLRDAICPVRLRPGHNDLGTNRTRPLTLVFAFVPVEMEALATVVHRTPFPGLATNQAYHPRVATLRV